jgi:hypothetical protein
MVDRIKTVVIERGIEMGTPEIAGGGTGLLVRKARMIGAGDNAREVEEFEVDTGTLREGRESLKQAAIELDQWEEKQTITVNTSMGQRLADARRRIEGPDDAIEAEIVD